jgi:hypothetical protein
MGAALAPESASNPATPPGVMRLERMPPFAPRPRSARQRHSANAKATSSASPPMAPPTARAAPAPPFGAPSALPGGETLALAPAPALGAALRVGGSSTAFTGATTSARSSEGAES